MNAPKTLANLLTANGLDYLVTRSIPGDPWTWTEERTLHEAPAVDALYQNVPAWFIELMRKVDPKSDWWDVTEALKGTNSDWNGDGEAAIYIMREQFETRGWMDHMGWTADSGTTRLISEPYGLDKEEMAALLSFVNRCDLVLDLGGVSHHYPGRTIRIEIYPKEDRAGCRF
jgi:hypothetical protein